MGVEYTIYTEVYLKDKWYNIDSYTLTPAGEFKLSPLLKGKSFVREFLDHIDNFQTINFSDLADTTQKYMIEQTYQEYMDQLLSMKFDVYDFYSEVKSKYVREYQYEYYALRYSVAAFEIGEIEEIDYWRTRESYDELSTEEQKEYVFFKWTEPDSWYKLLTNVITRVEIRLADFFAGASWDNDFGEYFQHANPVRLVVEIS